MAKLGGYSETIDLHPEIQIICDKIKPAVEEKAGQKFEAFIGLGYIHQVVSGMNYIIKVYVGYAGADECIHVKVYQNLPYEGGTLTLSGLQYNYSKGDPIEPF